MFRHAAVWDLWNTWKSLHYCRDAHAQITRKTGNDDTTTADRRNYFYLANFAESYVTIGSIDGSKLVFACQLLPVYSE